MVEINTQSNPDHDSNYSDTDIEETARHIARRLMTDTPLPTTKEVYIYSTTEEIIAKMDSEYAHPEGFKLADIWLYRLWLKGYPMMTGGDYDYPESFTTKSAHEPWEFIEGTVERSITSSVTQNATNTL